MAPPARAPAAEQALPRDYLAVLATAALCYAALGLVLRILPQYVPGRLGGGAVGVGLAVGAPALGAIVCRPLGGRWADRRGPLQVLLVGAAGMAAAAPFALVPSLALLLASRLAVGAGEGLMMSAAALWLLRLGGSERRGRSMGHIGLANYAGLVAGPLLAIALGGDQHPARVFLLSSVLPLVAATVVLAARPRRGGAAGEREAPAPLRRVLALTLRPGLGLMLVNVGYAALISFGAAAIAANGAGASGLVVPVFAAVVFAVRGLAGSLPDRAGAERTLLVSCPAAALGLAGVALLPSTPLVLLSVALLAAGQAFAVPALGLIALRGAPASQHGATAGLFFAWFDAGVGLGGPLTGLAALLSDAAGALLTGAAAVALTPLIAGVLPGRRAAPAAHGAGAERRPRSARAPAPRRSAPREGQARMRRW